MKVQPGKANVQSQVKTTTDDVSTPAQPVSPTDVFSALINSLSSQPAAADTDTEDNADKSNENQIDSVQTRQEQPVFDALFSAINFQYPAVDDGTEVVVPEQQAADSMLADKITAPVVTPSVPTTTTSDEIKSSMPAVNQNMAAKDQQSQAKPEPLVLQDVDEALNALPDFSILEQEKKLTQKKPAVITQDMAKTSASASESEQPEAMRRPVKFMAPALNLDTNSTQSVTLLSLLKGQTYQPDQQTNKYVDALAQMGNLINGETMRSFAAVDNKPAEMLMREASSVDYGEIISKNARPEYELKIDLLPLASGSVANQVYTANIKIYPPELGSVIAKLKMDKKDAELIIVTENNRVKEVVESNLSQLKQQFQQSDINLTNIHVEVQTSHTGSGEQNQQNPHTTDNSMSKEDDNRQNKSNLASDSPRQRLNSLIDTYA